MNNNNVEKMKKEMVRISEEYDVIGVHWTPNEKSKDIFKYDYVAQFISKHEKNVTIFGYNSIKDMIKNLKEIKSYDDIWK